MINLTLVVQIAHFFCAYLILTRIFFRPALAAYYGEMATAKALQHAYEEAVKNASSCHEAIVRERQNFFNRLRTKMPMIEHEPHSFVYDGMPFDCTVPRVQGSVDLLAQKIVDHVEKL